MTLRLIVVWIILTFAFKKSYSSSSNAQNRSWKNFSDIDSVQELISHPCSESFEDVDIKGNTIFHHLIALVDHSSNPFIDIIKAEQILDHAFACNPYMDVNKYNNDQQTILDLASKSQNSHQLIPTLLKWKFDKVNYAFYSVLGKYGSLDIAQELMKQTSFTGSMAINDEYPLTTAVRRLAKNIVIELLDRPDVDVNSSDRHKNTALHHLIKFAKDRQVSPENTETAASIIREFYARRPDIDVNLRNIKNLNVLELAASANHKGNLLIPTILVKQFGAVNNAFYYYLSKNPPSDVLLEMMKQHSFAGNIAVRGEFPLTSAIKKLAPNIVEVLLNRADVDVNSIDGEKNTALHHVVLASDIYATSQSNIVAATQIIELLYSKCPLINVNLENKYKETPLDIAVASSHHAHLLIPALLGNNKQFIKANYAFYKICKRKVDSSIALELMKQRSFNVNMSVNDEFPLQTAVKNLHVDHIKALIKMPNVDINAADISFGNTAMHHLIKTCDYNATTKEDLVQGIAIIDEFHAHFPYINVNIKNKNQETILDLAASLPYKAYLLILTLLNKWQFENVNYAFYHIFSKNDCKDIARELMKQKSFNVNLPIVGEYPLSTAAKNVSLEFVKEILKRTNVNVNATNVFGNTAIHSIIIFLKGSTECNDAALQAILIIQEIYAYSPEQSSDTQHSNQNNSPLDVDICNNDGDTILDLAVKSSKHLHFLIPTLLSKQFKSKNNAFYQVLKTEKFDNEIAIELIRQKSFSGSIQICREYPLETAMKAFAVDIVRILLERSDVDPNATDTMGDTALHHLIKKCDCNFISSKEIQDASRIIAIVYTCSPDIDVNIKNRYGLTFLDVAATSSHYAHLLIPSLLQGKQFENINFAFYKIMKKYEYQYIAPKLMQQASFSASQPINNIYPLTLAVKNFSIDIVKQIISLEGVDINATDGEGRTALHHLVLSCNYYYDFIDMKKIEKAKEIIEEIFLRFPSVNVNQKSNEGLTVLDLAAQSSSKAHFLIPTLLQKRFNDVTLAVECAIKHFDHSLLSQLIENYSNDFSNVKIGKLTPLQYIFQKSQFTHDIAQTISLILTTRNLDMCNVHGSLSYFELILTQYYILHQPIYSSSFRACRSHDSCKPHLGSV